MAKSYITHKRSVSIKGILNVDSDENSILVELEDGRGVEFGDILKEFDGADVSITVSETTEQA